MLYFKNIMLINVTFNTILLKHISFDFTSKIDKL